MGHDGHDQARAHGGHSHSHGHDNLYLTSTNSKDPGVRITRIGLYVNLGMAISKAIGGYVFNSKALTADALHALTDLVSDIMTLATISYSLKPANTRFPLGYGKIESLGGLGVSGLLFTGGIMIGIQALMALTQQWFPDLAHIFEHVHIHSHSHGGSELGPNINAAWLAAGSIVIKEWLFRATMKVAKQKRSSILSSNAYHHRVDSLTALVALVTICASNFLTNAQWLDPVGGLIISGMIVQAGYVNTKAALYELADAGISTEIKEKVQQSATTALAEHVGSSAQVRGVQGIKSGQNILMEVDVMAPSDWTVSKTRDVEDILRNKIAAGTRGVRRVTVRFTDAQDGEAFQDEFIAARTRESEPAEEHNHDHEHEHVHSNGHATSSATSANGSALKRK